MMHSEGKKVYKLLHEMRTAKPLVHNITNVVVANFTANGLLAAGASPVMANAKEEAADMASAADALVLNIGTLNPMQVESMLLAGAAANKKGIPVVLDPVGAGATAYRTDTARQLLSEIDISLIRGNAGEIAAVAGLESDTRGVDSGSSQATTAETAEQAFGVLNIPIVVTGAVDAVTDGKDMYRIHNGHSMMTKVTGSGCLLSSLIGSFLTITEDTAYGAAAALGYYGIAAEKAGGFASMRGPGTFQAELLNALYHVGDMDIRQQLTLKKEALKGPYE